MDKDGYNAIQLASIDLDKDIKKVKKSQRKNFSSINLKPKKFVGSQINAIFLDICVSSFKFEMVANA